MGWAEGWISCEAGRDEERLEFGANEYRRSCITQGPTSRVIGQRNWLHTPSRADGSHSSPPWPRSKLESANVFATSDPVPVARACRPRRLARVSLVTAMVTAMGSANGRDALAARRPGAWSRGSDARGCSSGASILAKETASWTDREPIAPEAARETHSPSPVGNETRSGGGVDGGDGGVWRLFGLCAARP